MSKYGIRHFSPLTRGDARGRRELNSQNLDLLDQEDDLKFKVQVEVWGSGKPMREFLWSEDMADACVYLMENVDFKDIVNEPSERSQEISAND